MLKKEALGIAINISAFFFTFGMAKPYDESLFSTK
jgi:hypothetical protein